MSAKKATKTTKVTATKALAPPSTEPAPIIKKGAAIGGQQGLKDWWRWAQQQLAVRANPQLRIDQIQQAIRLAFAKTPKLFGCTAGSVWEAVTKADQLGLDFSGTLGSGYLVPFKNECVFIPGYRGYIDLARRSGQVDTIQAHIVYSCDEFEVELGTEPRVKHKPNWQSPERVAKNIVGVYMFARLKGSSTPIIELMNRQQVEKIRQVSRASAGDAWTNWWDEMARKSVVRRGIKYLPLTTELKTLATYDDKVSGIESLEVIDGTAAEPAAGVKALAAELGTLRQAQGKKNGDGLEQKPPQQTGPNMKMAAALAYAEQNAVEKLAFDDIVAHNADEKGETDWVAVKAQLEIYVAEREEQAEVGSTEVPDAGQGQMDLI